MEKNWLIRTKNNHILGPVSKSKVKELISNGSLKGDDEICSGNGYWLFIRETELIDKYIHGDFIQDFNPVSEASSVVAKTTDLELDENSQADDSDIFPDAQDLAYPDDDDITLVGGIDISQLENNELNESNESNESNEATETSGAREIELEVPIETPKETPKETSDEITEDENIKLVSTDDQKNASKTKKQARPTTKSSTNNPKLSGTILRVVAALFFVLILLALYFRNRILNYENETVSFQLINSAHAQIKDGVVEKKKLRPSHPSSIKPMK